MIPPIHTWLNVTAVTDLISDRLFPFEDGGTSPAYPYVTWFVPTSRAETKLSEAPDTDNDRVQIDCWSRDQAEVIAVAQAVRAELDKHGHQILKIVHGIDPETKTYRIQFDYSFWVSR